MNRVNLNKIAEVRDRPAKANQQCVYCVKWHDLEAKILSDDNTMKPIRINLKKIFKWFISLRYIVEFNKYEAERDFYVMLGFRNFWIGGRWRFRSGSQRSGQ